MTMLRSIWRALQCIRRYLDTNRESIHLLNSGKYLLTVSFYVALSVYRTHETFPNRCVFIVLATANTSVNSVWDVCYDWRLGNPHARYPFLRRNLKFTAAWLYYVAILIKVLLRFTWILYIAIPQQLQHSAVTSCGVSVGEVCRRGLWSLFRIENEHCNRNNIVEGGKALPHSSWLFSKLESREARERCHSGASGRGYRSPTYSRDALTDGKPNATSPCTRLAVPECVFPTSTCCTCDKRQR